MVAVEISTFFHFGTVSARGTSMGLLHWKLGLPPGNFAFAMQLGNLRKTKL
jgi:hypothetical protein